MPMLHRNHFIDHFSGAGRATLARQLGLAAAGEVCIFRFPVDGVIEMKNGSPNELTEPENGFPKSTKTQPENSKLLTR